MDASQVFDEAHKAKNLINAKGMSPCLTGYLATGFLWKPVRIVKETALEINLPM